MRTFISLITIRAECEDDARELIEEYTGNETSVEILQTLEVKE